MEIERFAGFFLWQVWSAEKSENTNEYVCQRERIYSPVWQPGERKVSGMHACLPAGTLWTPLWKTGACACARLPVLSGEARRPLRSAARVRACLFECAWVFVYMEKCRERVCRWGCNVLLESDTKTPAWTAENPFWNVWFDFFFFRLHVGDAVCVCFF